jgi:hypothetical protein
MRILMKVKIVMCMVVLLVAQGAIGQLSTNFLFRDPSRVINDSTRSDLTPLYSWWAKQLEAEQAARLAEQKVGAPAGFTANTSDRPMAPWLHIIGDIANDQPEGWIVDATVESAPGKGNSARILVIHPPRKEQDRFSQRQNVLNNPPPQPDYSEQEANIKVLQKRAFVAETIGDEDLQDYYDSLVQDARRDLDARKNRDQSIANERAGAIAALGDFPADWQTYRIDLFVFNTGRQLNGLPVFDAGLSFAK